MNEHRLSDEELEDVERWPGSSSPLVKSLLREVRERRAVEARQSAATATGPRVELPIGSLVAEACARAAHEANRAYCLAVGDNSQPHWEEAPEWQRSSARNGVVGALSGNTPEQSHEQWLEDKLAAGWTYGPVKDPDKKQHPCMVPYSELPQEQRAKDSLFIDVVGAVAVALVRAGKGGW